MRITNKSLGLSRFPVGTDAAMLIAEARKLAPVGEVVCVVDAMLKRRESTRWYDRNAILTAFILAEDPFQNYNRFGCAL